MKINALGKRLMRCSVLLVLVGLVVGCAGQPAQPPSEPETIEVTRIVEGETIIEVITATPEPSGAEPEWLPRKDTIRLMCCGDTFGGDGFFPDSATWNPLGPGRVEFSWFIFEPLAFYNGLTDVETLWLAESYEYNEDLTELTIHIRPGVEWSDGVPFTATDVAFTINTLRDNAPAIQWSTDVEKAVEYAEVVDDLTAKVVFKQPEPRFFREVFSYHFMMGIAIVPEHIYKDVEDVASFTNLDLAKGWPVGTSAYRVIESSPERKVFDLSEDWWAAKTGFAELPEIPRIMMYPKTSEEKMLQLLALDELDGVSARTPTMIEKVMEQNPNLSSYSGRELPYGYLDYWPFGLSFNCSEPPFDNKDVRWAISYAIDRQEVVDISSQGGGMISAWNMPPYPKLETYKAAIADLFEEYPTTEYNLTKSAELMEKAGYSKGADGFWQDAEGTTLSFTVQTFSWALAETIPMIQQLREAGFDVDYVQQPDSYMMMMQGTADAYVFGHGASITDPYAAMRMYHSRYTAPTGEMATYQYRWVDENYDAIVDQMATVDPDDPQTIELLRQGMEIWLEALPDIPVVQNFHRNPHNETYWESWPSLENPVVNDAWWHTTALLWVYQIDQVEQAQ